MSVNARSEDGGASITTDHEMRDGHLKSADFLDLENHPTLTFVSTSVVPKGGDRFDLVGDLTIRATFAIPLGGDDLTHVGYLFSVKGGPTVYFTGDTGYHDLLGDAVAPHKPDVLATVINGAFHNLGPFEAAELARRVNARVVIPCHYDLFPDNSLPPQLLRTNLKLLGLEDRYRVLEHGVAFDYPA